MLAEQLKQMPHSDLRVSPCGFVFDQGLVDRLLDRLPHDEPMHSRRSEIRPQVRLCNLTKAPLNTSDPIHLVCPIRSTRPMACNSTAGSRIGSTRKTCVASTRLRPFEPDDSGSRRQLTPRRLSLKSFTHLCNGFDRFRTLQLFTVNASAMSTRMCSQSEKINTFTAASSRRSCSTVWTIAVIFGG